MNRRDLIKSISLTFGYAIAAPTVLTALESCSKKDTSWESLFLNDKEKNYVTHLVDIILPASDIPGGLDIQLPQFVDMMLHDMLTEDDKELFTAGSQLFADKFAAVFEQDISMGDKDKIGQLFKNYFDLKGDDKSAVLRRQAMGILLVEPSEKEDFLLYNFLMQVRSLSLFGYFTSEKIGREVLNFDPIPGSYNPCIPLEDIGNAWTI
ncbi:gluconate 2-dehydrogenase subunit 3 family protein [Lutimonas sp.]|uniref:gluconate 2-dehydrogenase subunit 3 family protein n=1 Tax=Lutimonas sp. TaxID=1872403 RepID=UPI003D9B8AEC